MANSSFGNSIPAKAVDVTPHDSNGNAFSRLFVGVAGTVRIVDPEGNTSNWTVPAGTYIEQQTAKVMSTGTSPGTGIVGQA